MSRRSRSFQDDNAPMYNVLFDELEKNNSKFDRSNISNGHFTFHEVITYLKENGIIDDFFNWLKNKNESFVTKVMENLEEEMGPLDDVLDLFEKRFEDTKE
jgi:Cdc6-like AAA superfamily ATPase